MLRSVSRLVHRGIDDVLVEAYRLLPKHPLRLATGPLKGSRDVPLGGLPPPTPLLLPPIHGRAHVALQSPHPAARGDNARMHLHVYPAARPARGVVVLCPFWLCPSPLAMAPYTRMLRARGFHVVLYVPPDHMERTPRGFFSGERLLGWDLPHMENMLQLVASEVRDVVGAYKAHGHKVMLVGLSLGGLYAATAAVGGADADGLALLTPAVDMQVSMARTRMGRQYRNALHHRGDVPPPEDLLTVLGAPYRPANWPRPLPADRIFLAHGAHDAVVPLDVAEDLSARWNVPLHTYRAGHMSLLFLTPGMKRDLGRFLDGCAGHVSTPHPSNDRQRRRAAGELRVMSAAG